MTKAAAEDLAARLLDAQVAWVVEQLTGPALAEILEDDVDELLSIGEHLTLGQLTSVDSVTAVVRRWVAVSGDSAAVTALVDALADAIYHLPAASENTLGSVVAREHVDALVTTLLSMHRAQDGAMNRLQQSPAVAGVASTFVGTLVADFVQQNRDRVERLPGARSLVSLGLGAANRAKGLADTVVGDAAGKGAQLAVKRVNAAVRDLVRTAPLHQAALEVWDIYADDPISAFREFVTAGDVRGVAQIVRALIADTRGTDYALALVDGIVEAVFALYGDVEITSVLTDLGLGRPELLFALEQIAPDLLVALRDSGDLERLVRHRLAPFFADDDTLALLELADDPDAVPSRPATVARKTAATKAATQTAAKKTAAKKTAAKKTAAKTAAKKTS